MTKPTKSEGHGVNSAHLSGRLVQPSDCRSFYYHYEIPPFVGPALERLYGSLYSSLAHLATEGKLHNVSTYAVRKGSELITVFLFIIKENRLEVLNEVIRIGEEDINRFAHFAFDTFKTVNIVSFKSIQPDIGRLSFQFQRFNCLEDMVVTLPPSVGEYMMCLSAKMRKGLRYKLKIITRDFPSFKFMIFEGANIHEQHIREIVQLNRLRMVEKNKVSCVVDETEERLIRLAKECGLIVAASIDGRICGGVISCRVGENYFSLMVAHDPQYNAYSLGMLCGFHGICEAIGHGGKEFHWLWGRYKYKYSFLAMPRELDVLAIYRSKAHFFLNSKFAGKMWLNGQQRKFLQWLRHVKQGEGLVITAAFKILNLRRKLMGVKQQPCQHE